MNYLPSVFWRKLEIFLNIYYLIKKPPTKLLWKENDKSWVSSFSRSEFVYDKILLYFMAPLLISTWLHLQVVGGGVGHLYSSQSQMQDAVVAVASFTNPDFCIRVSSPLPVPALFPCNPS